MKTKSLLETNPYLKDPVARDRAIDRFVVTSSGVEGVKIDMYLLTQRQKQKPQNEETK